MIYSKLLENVLLPIGDIFNGSSFIKELRKWRKIQHLSAQELADMQKENLHTMLMHCTANIPYYKALNIKKHENPYEWIKEFPIVKKTTFKKDIDAFLSEPKESLIPHISSGSSGVQGVVYMNKAEQSVCRALQVVWWEWSGYKMGHPIVQTGVTSKRSRLKSIKDVLFRTKYTAAFGHTEETMKALLESIDVKKDYFLGGYPSSLYLFAEVAKKHQINHIKFKNGISWGDKLFPKYKELIESQFHTKMRDTYGCTEGAMIAAEGDLPYMYIMSPHVYIEIVDENGIEVPDGTLGFVLVTRLDAFSMPLVRYYIGDMAIKLPVDKYPEKRERNFPLLQKLIGRDTDIVRTASGKHITVHIFVAVFKVYSQIKQFKVFQRNLNEIEIEYIADADFKPELLVEIESKIHDFLKEKFKIKFIQVDYIAPSKSGKPQIVESHLEKAI